VKLLLYYFISLHESLPLRINNIINEIIIFSPEIKENFWLALFRKRLRKLIK
jgi:hypothetical protein